MGKGIEIKVMEKKEAVSSSVKEEAVTEEELSTVKRESLSSGDFVDLGFDVSAAVLYVQLNAMQSCVGGGV